MSLAVFIAAAVAVAVAVGCGSSKARDAISALRDQPLDPDLEALRKTDPGLVLYREATRIRTGFAEARGIAATASAVYAVGDRSVRQFSLEGKLLGETKLSFEPQCVAVDDQGTAYVGANDHVAVVKGATVESWPGLGAKALITAVAVASNGVWVADAGNRLVIHYSLDGRELGDFGKRDPATKYPGLIAPSPHLDLAVTPAGNVIVTNPGTHRVETHDPNGKLLSAWGRESPDIDGFCGCCNPTDIALASDGSIVTSEKGLPRVKLYSAAGKFIGVVASADTFNENVAGIDLAVAGPRIFALDPFSKVIRVYMSKSGAKP